METAQKVRRPVESAISEGNLVENPIFVLTNKEARPLGKNGEVHPADYTRTLMITTSESSGHTVEKSIVISAHQKYGFPTMFAYRILIALFDEAKKKNFSDPVIHISRNELAKRIGYDIPGSKVYADISNALNALRTLNIEYRNTWYEKGSGRHPGKESCAGLISEYNFEDERLAEKPAPGSPIQIGSWIRISDLIFNSLRAGYYNGVDLQYMNAVKKSPLAVRLYAYLAKKDVRGVYTENLKGLAAKLNLKRKAPSAIYKDLAPALDLLASAMPVGKLDEQRKFIDTWKIPPDRSHLSVAFYRPSEAAS